MYETPQTSDFQRNIAGITQKSEAEAHAERLRIISDAVMKGAAQSNRVIIAVIIPFEKLYDKTVEDVMKLIKDFVERTSPTPAELGAIARAELEWFADRLLGQLPDAGFPQDAARIRGEYREKFQQRVEGALRDIQIGFIGGRRSRQRRPCRRLPRLPKAVILKPTFMGMGIDLQKAWNWALGKLRSVGRD